MKNSGIIYGCPQTFCTYIFGDWLIGLNECFMSKSTNNFELEQIEKSENCSYQYEILILETRLFSVFVNTWYTESILFSEQIDFVK